MNNFGRNLLRLVLCFLTLVAFNSLWAQDIEVLITPDEVEIQEGGSVQFQIYAFTMERNRTPLPVDAVSWAIGHDSLGTITEDGFFMAGRRAGVVEIEARVVVGRHTFRKVAVVRVGSLPKAFFDIEVVPRRAVVPIGHEQQFEVVVNKPGGDRVRPQHVRWEVRPEGMGKIDENGLFFAGDETAEGHVVAVVEIDGLRLRDAAKVIVSSPASASITGLVANEDGGSPIGGAVVKAIRLGRIHWVQKAETDSDGNYVLEDLIPGFYAVYANARGFVGEYFDDAPDFLQATPVSVGEEEAVPNINFALTEGASISGKVVANADGSPLKAHVVAFLAVAPRFSRHVVTDENGDYEIDSLPSGSYIVRADAAGYRAEFYDDVTNLLDAEPVTVEPPDQAEEIDFSLEQASSISGVVTSVEDGSPIAGAHIRVFGRTVSTGNSLRSHETRTNENGEYLIEVRPGSYYVHASADGFNGEFYDNAQTLREATLVEVQLDSHTDGIDFELGRRSSISGVVTDETTTEPVAGAIVEAFPEQSGLDAANTIAGFRARTDELGQYTIENVPAGLYLVRTRAEGYLPEFYLESPDKENATPVEVQESSAATDINFTLGRGGSIEGVVAAEADDRPIRGALINVFHADSRRAVRTYSREDGSYSVGGLPSGTYHVQAIARGFQSEFYQNARGREEASPVDVVAPDVTSGIDFLLAGKSRERGTIAGRVLSDGDESSIEGAIVIAVSARGRNAHIGFSDDEGRYEVSRLTPGDYFVFALARGFVGEFFDDAPSFQEADAVAVESGQVSDGVDFGLAPRQQNGLYAISGKVVAGDGTPLQGVLVQAKIDGDIEVNAVTDANGVYVIDDLAAGAYQIEATGVGFLSAYFGGAGPETAESVVVGNREDATGINLALQSDNVTSIEDGQLSLPDSYALHANYPNPFNPETAINYQLSGQQDVSLKIYNLLGQEIATLVEKVQPAGVYSVSWNGQDAFGRAVASGIYIFRLEAGDVFKMSRRMLLLK